MYIYFKSKYKKILWFILGFLLACGLIDKVHAYELPNGLNIDNSYIQSLWTTYFQGKSPNDIYSGCSLNYQSCSNIYSNSSTPFNFVYVGYASNGYTQIFFARYSQEIIVGNDGNNKFFYFDLMPVQWDSSFNDLQYEYYPGLTISPNNTINYNIYNSSTTVTFSSSNATDNYNGIYNFSSFALNFDLYQGDNLLKLKNFDYPSSLPNYLNGYQNITLTTDDKYYILSGLSSGSVFIPIDDFNSSGGRLSYYDNDLSSQPYTSYIQDYTVTSDGLYVRQDFNLNNYYGADFVMFSKYIYLEGEDDITYDIWVPADITYSDVTITPNESGGNDFEFQYKDSNGDIQNQITTSVDLSQDNPLLGNIFNDFSSNTFGLTSIVTAPLSLISSLSSTSCSSLTVPLPYISSNLTLPCMSNIYSNTFGSFFTLYQTITNGIISYWVIVKIFNLVKDFKNPDHDEIEVIDL